VTAVAREPVGPDVLRSVLAVGFGGAVGANARYLVGREVAERWPSLFPWGTLVVNITGCLALGLLTGWLLARGDRPVVRLLIATGFLGAYTTFSTFAYEAVCLTDDGEFLSAGAYVAASLVICLAAAGAGLHAGRAIRAPLWR
jgi:fluoride exporter